MEWLSNIYQNFEGLLSNLAQYIQSNPKVGHLIGIFYCQFGSSGLYSIGSGRIRGTVLMDGTSYSKN